jgi:hypothetical protein
MKKKISKRQAIKLLKLHADYICKLALFYSEMNVDFELQPALVMPLIQARQLIQDLSYDNVDISKFEYLLKIHISQFQPLEEKEKER